MGASRLVEKARLARMNRRPKPQKRTVRELVATTMAHGPGAAAKASVRSRVNRARGLQCTAVTEHGDRCRNNQEPGSEGHGTGSCWLPSHKRQVGGSSQRAS
ncbi:MAG: hypothetical protein ACRDP8_16455 [Actinopolymorphaceae bacterium]